MKQIVTVKTLPVLLRDYQTGRSSFHTLTYLTSFAVDWQRPLQEFQRCIPDHVVVKVYLLTLPSYTLPCGGYYVVFKMSCITWKWLDA